MYLFNLLSQCTVHYLTKPIFLLPNQTQLWYSYRAKNRLLA